MRINLKTSCYHPNKIGGAGGDLHPAWRHSKHVVLMFILARTVRLFIEFLVSFSAATTSDEVTGIHAIRLMVVSVYLFRHRSVYFLPSPGRL